MTITRKTTCFGTYWPSSGFIQENLHVSALDNGHLQVVHELLIKAVIQNIHGLLIWGRVGVK